MIIDLTTNPMALSEVMEFDCVIRVHEDGTVTDDVQSVWAPDLHDGELEGADWSLMNGYSGQYGYSGPSMHASEFIGGNMARDILATPGLYVALVDYPLDGEEPEGWAVARRVCSHSWVAGMMVVNDADLDTVAAARQVECENCDASYHVGDND